MPKVKGKDLFFNSNIALFYSDFMYMKLCKFGHFYEENKIISKIHYSMHKKQNLKGIMTIFGIFTRYAIKK